MTTDRERALVEAAREALGWLRDPDGLDDPLCCGGGAECGCRGSTHRDLLDHMLSAALSQYEEPKA
jgi:hypothetical protein